MSKKLGIIWNFLAHYKYLIVIVLGVAVVGFLDDNSYRRRVQLELQIDDLKSEIARYNSQYEHDAQQLRDLNLSTRAIERVARERYFMKADDEDIYVLSDDEQPYAMTSEEGSEK